MRTMKDLIDKGLENDVEISLKVKDKKVVINGSFSIIQCIILAASLILVVLEKFDKDKTLAIMNSIIEENLNNNNRKE